MSRSAALLILFALGALCVAQAKQARSLQDAGQANWFHSSPAKKYSYWKTDKNCYWPIKTDSQWTFYRIGVKLEILYADTWSPSNLTKISLFQGVSYGDVIDLTTNQKIGVWQAFTVSTADEDLGPGIIVGTISNLVIELGPQGDDSLTIAGATSTLITGVVNDDDNAITGGIGKYLGATGNFAYKYLTGGATPTSVEGELNIWVPRLKVY